MEQSEISSSQFFVFGSPVLGLLRVSTALYSNNREALFLLTRNLQHILNPEFFDCFGGLSIVFKPKFAATEHKSFFCFVYSSLV